MVTRTSRPLNSLSMLIGALAIISVVCAVFVAPRVEGEGVKTQTFDIVYDESNISLIPAPGHTGELGFPERGDFLSGSGAIYAQGKSGGDAIGKVYFMAVGTANADAFQTSANQMYENARLEIWGQGSIDISGTADYFGPSYLSIVGGTGIYSMARGQCTETHRENSFDTLVCQIQ